MISSNPAVTGSSTAAFTVTLPTITLGANPTVCYTGGAQTPNLPYSASTSASNYTITWDAAALAAGFTNTSGGGIVGGGGNIVLSVPATATAVNTYNAVLTVDNGTCTSANYSISVTVTNTPTLTGVSATAVCTGTSSVITLSGLIPSLGGNVITYAVPTIAGGADQTVTVASNISGDATFNLPVVIGDNGQTLTIKSIANGCTNTLTGITTTLTVNALPTITLSAIPAVCFSAGSQSASLAYTATTGTPTTYTITGWSAAAVTAGFTNVGTTALPASPILVSVPASAPVSASSYTATLTVNNGTCNSIAYTITVPVNTVPTVTPTSVTVALGNATASLAYTATGTPTTYTIDYDAALNAQGLADITTTTLSASPLTLTGFASITAATYNNTITVSTATCSSTATAFTINVRAPITYYSKGSLDANLTTSWTDTRSNATSNNPPDFVSGDIFVIENGDLMTTSATWTVSGGTGNKIQIESGGRLTNTFAVATSNFQIDPGGTFVFAFVNGTAGVASDIPGSVTRNFTTGAGSANCGTIEIQKWGNGTATPAALPSGITWGNLIINITTAMSGGWTQSGAIALINGNLTINSIGVAGTQRAFAFNASTPTSFTTVIKGNVVVDGTATTATALLTVNNGSSTPTFSIEGTTTVTLGTLVLNTSGTAGTTATSYKLTGNVTVNTGGTFTSNTSGRATITIDNDITINGGTINVHGSGICTFNVGNDFIASSGTVTLMGSTSAATSLLYVARDLVLSGATATNGSSAAYTVTTGRDLTVSGGTFTTANSTSALPTINVGRDLNISGGNLTNSSSGTGGTGLILGIGRNLNASSGTFLIGSSSSTTTKITITGDINITGGTVQGTSSSRFEVVAGGSFNLSSGTWQTQNSSTASTYVFDIGGNFNMTGGTFTGGSTNTVLPIRFTGGVASVSYTQSGGTITAAKPITYTVAGSGPAKTLTLNNDISLMTSTSVGAFTVKNGATLIMGTQVIGGAGTFTNETGSTVKTAHLQGLSTTASTGAVQVNSTKSFNSGANYEFNGAAAQVTGNFIASTTSTANTVNNLTINNSSNVSLSNSVTVTGTLAFTAGKLILGTNNITIPNTASITGVPAFGSTSGNGWIVTDNTGSLIRQGVGATNVLFPVGPTASSYNPAQINNAGTTDNFTVNVRDVDLPGISAAYGVKDQWTITEGTPGGSSSTVSLQWNAGDEQGSFLNTNCSFVRTDGTDIVSTPTYTDHSTPGPPYTVSEGAITDFTTYCGVTTQSPKITVSTPTLNFGDVALGGSAQLNYSVSGIGLLGNLIVTPPNTDFQVSLTSGSGWASSVSLAPSGGTVSSTTIYVLYTPSAATGSIGPLNITNASTGASTKNVAASAVALAADPGTSAPAVSCGSPAPTSIPLTLTAGSGSNCLVSPRC